MADIEGRDGGNVSGVSEERRVLENRSMYDVPKEQYVTVIREMIRHENDLPITAPCGYWLFKGSWLTHMSLHGEEGVGLSS